VPSAADVACIGSGKTVNLSTGVQVVTVVQGAGTLKLSGSSSTLEVTAPSGEAVSTLGSLIFSNGGTLTGPGTLEVTGSLTATGGNFSLKGTGRTVIKPGATAELKQNSSALISISERTLRNEGTLTFSSGSFSASNGAAIENTGTFKANAEPTLNPAFKHSAGAAPLIVNSGSFEKTAGSGKTVVSIPYENQAATTAKSGILSFAKGGSGVGGDSWTATAEGAKVVFDDGAFSLASTTALAGNFRIGSASVAATGGFNSPSSNLTMGLTGSLTLNGDPLKLASLSIEGGTLSIGSTEEPSSVSSLAFDGGTLTGPGTLEVTGSLTATGGNFSLKGTGRTVIKPGATAELKQNSSALISISERTLRNEGTLTFSSGSFSASNGAAIENTGTFKANAEPTLNPAFKHSAGAAPLIVNSGSFEKTAGSGKTVVDVNFENLGRIYEQTGKLDVRRPVAIGHKQQFGKRCHTGDPVECATGNLVETQSDILIGGRGVGLSLIRFYSAQTAAAASSPGAFGYGWTSSFSDSLQVEGGGEAVTLTQSNGSMIPFKRESGAIYSAPRWSQDTLTGSPESGYLLTGSDQAQFRFSGSGRLESIADRSGNETTLSYDVSGRLKDVTDPAGRQITYTYNANGQVESVEDPMGHVVKYAYETKHLKSVRLAGEEGARWQFKYDGSHRITTMIDGRGGETTNEYDASSRVKSQTDPGGHTLTFEYAPFHTVVTNKATGAVTDLWFTSNNQPYSITRGFGTAEATTEAFSYNEAGQLVAAVDGNGHKTTYAYDVEGNLKSEKDAEGNETKRAYNATHDVISVTTPGGETTTIERDGDGSVESISRPGPEETMQTSTFEHDEFGQLESATDPLERIWTFAYNEQGDRIASTDPAGNTRGFEYDESSRLTAIVNPRGNTEGAEAAKFTITIERDPQGRARKVVDPLGHVSEYAYDANGNLERKTNANGHTTKYVYSADNERIKVEKPNGAILETAYDGAGNVTSQTDGNKKTITYVHNALGQPVEVIDPLSRKTIEEFDDVGNLKAVVDPAERETSYVYDNANRLIEVAYSDPATPDVEFEYDANGNVTNMVDGTGESIFDYDELGRLIQSENGRGDVVGYGYDLAEQLTGILYPNGKSISRAFDQAGRLESITDWLGGTTTFVYDADSNLEGIAFPTGTGNVDEYVYDQAGRMAEASFSKGMETLASLSYIRDKVGQIGEEEGAGLPGAEEIVYGYDKNERLIEAGETGFEYDAADNVTKAPGTTNAYDAASQLESGTGVSYAYNQLGQRIETAPGAGPATTYEYDQAGNLISVERPEEGKVPAIDQNLSYDGSGLLASKANGLVTQYLSWDFSAPQPQLLDDGQNSYVYGPGGLPVTQISSEEVPTYLHHDQLGSTRMLTDSSGEVVGTFSFSPYGKPEGSTGTATTPMGFAGQYADKDSGLQYLRARFYDPVTGQFMTKDPLAAILRTPYGYANQSPLQYVDPSGMSCVGVGHSGPVSYPTFDPDDCVEDAVDGAGDAAGSALNFGLDNFPLLAAPAVFLYCVYDPDGCTTAALTGAAGTGAANGIRAATEPCFDFWSATLEDLLVTFTAALPGGIFEATAGRAGPQLGPVVRRIIQVILDAPGLGLDLVHGAKGH
jgi:RHS repeat-associated protein